MGVSEVLGGVISPGRLKDAVCSDAAPREKQYKLFDGDGLYLQVMPTGAKYWRLKYRLAGADKTYAIGVYPEITLSAAREQRDRARAWLREGKDPTLERRCVKARATTEQETTFKVAAEAWYAEVAPTWAPVHRATQRTRLDSDLLPYLGSFPMKDITPAELLGALQRIYDRGAYDVVGKCKTIFSQVFRHSSVTTGLVADPAGMLQGRLQRPTPVVHRKRIPAEDLPQLFSDLREMPAEPVTKLALYFTIVTAARTGEVRFATWAEIQKGKRGEIWRVPPERMKMKREHVVPLSPIAIEILNMANGLRTSSDAGALIFPGFTKHGALSENAFLALLSRAGYFGRQTTHGFRGSFSTWAHEEAEANPDVIELCLAHVQGGVRGHYNDAKYLPQRRELLTAWAEQCKAWGMTLP